MGQVILLTGATDGLGALAAEMLAEQGHELILLGRNQSRLDEMVTALSPKARVACYVCDLSHLRDVSDCADKILAECKKIDVIINNAGILKSAETKTKDGLELRFAVNCIAPYLLTARLLPVLPNKGRVVNLSSAAQAPLNPSDLQSYQSFSDMAAYSQSKLAITAWTYQMAKRYQDNIFVSVNPGSLLGTKMVKEGFGIEGADISIGADIICRAAISDEFADANGLYYDNDAKCFGPPHEQAHNDALGQEIITVMEHIITTRLNQA